MLLHGQPGAGIEWQRVVAALGDAVDAVAPDRPGYGHNPLGPGGLAANVDWLDRLIEDQGDGRRAVIVAHSWAGGVALGLAQRRPDLMCGLVLAGSVGPGATTHVDRALAHPVIGGAAMRLAFGVSQPVLRRLLPRSEPDRDARAVVVDTFAANQARGLWRTVFTEQAALVRDLPAIVDRLERVTTRTWVVAGTRDRVVPFATARALADRLPAAELVAVPGAGHRLHRTHPDVIASVVLEALADCAVP